MNTHNFKIKAFPRYSGNAFERTGLLQPLMIFTTETMSSLKRGARKRRNLVCLSVTVDELVKHPPDPNESIPTDVFVRAASRGE